MHSTGEVVCGKCGWWLRAEESELLEAALLSHIVAAHVDDLLLFIDSLESPHFSAADLAMMDAFGIASR